MKKLFTLLFALVATTALWAHDFEVDGIYYKILKDKTNEVEVTYRGSSYSSYNEYTGSVTIPSTVTYNGTTYSVTRIGEDAFSICRGLTSVTIGNSVTSLGEGAFYHCKDLTSIIVEDANSTYDSRDNCNAIIETATNTLIAGCQNTTIPNSVTSIGEGAFVYCSGLTSVTIPNSVTSIGNGAFAECSSLTSVTIGNSVTTIEYAAFMSCDALTSITIPNSVTSIGEYAFYECSKLTLVTINSNAIVSKDYSYDDNISDIFGAQVTEYIIGESVTSIGDYAFSGGSSLTSVNIPNSVTSIGDYAFSGCSSLISVTIPNSVTSIGDYAFSNCDSLTSVTIGNSVTSIGSFAFMFCHSLTSVTIGNNVTSIGSHAFYGCDSLTSVTINSDAIVNKTYSYSSNISDIFGSQVTEYIIGDDVKGIGGYTFYGCSSLTSVTCEAETPPTVGQYAFDGVSRSIPVYVPCGCVEAYKAANGWKNFTNIQEALAEYSIEVDVNDNIMGTAKVNYNTFCEGNQISATPNFGYHFVQWSDGNTDNPRTLELTQDTILIAEFAQSFSGQCGDNLYWNYDTITQTISITGSGKMYDYTADSQPWFLFKEQIMEVVTSNTATSIGTSAFEGCLRLGKVSLGAAMENVAANAFAGCTRLYHIYCYPTDPPFADESSFANYNVYLHVPCNNKEEYDLDIIWGNFKYIECLSADEVEDTEDVIIESGTTTVIITWPTENNADTYTIVIKKDGEVVCTLTFNADGQLLNIAFAPGREGNRPAQYAEQANNGYRFTVTGLEEATDYTYTITTKDASNKTINTHSGKFTTKSITAVENTHSQSPISNCQKILRNGQLIILRDGVEYNAQGVVMNP